MATPDTQKENVWDGLRQRVREEFEHLKSELEEIELLLDQSQIEVNKITQRNASITAHLQQVQGQFDSLPRGDIRVAYDSALDAQQRLFVMRGQVEKFQSDQQHLQRYVDFLMQIENILAGGQPGDMPANAAQTTVESVEMIIEAQEAERQRLSRQMHDGPAQALSNFILQTEIAMRLFDIDQLRAREELSSLKSSATNAFQKVRDFIFELRPMMLDDLGLSPTIKRFVDALKDHPGMDIRLVVTGMERRLEPYIEVMIFRAIQELLTNAVRHSQATSIKVQLDMGDTNVKVSVEDNGKGFEPSLIEERGFMGIKMVKERAEKLGGFLDVDSTPGNGTRITFQIPAQNVGAG